MSYYIEDDSWLNCIAATPPKKNKRTKQAVKLDRIFVECREDRITAARLDSIDYRYAYNTWRWLYNKRKKAFDRRDPDPLLYFLD